MRANAFGVDGFEALCSSDLLERFLSTLKQLLSGSKTTIAGVVLITDPIRIIFIFVVLLSHQLFAKQLREMRNANDKSNNVVVENSR